MRIVKILTVTVFGILSLTLLIAAVQKKAPHGVPNVFRNNNCVTCHAGLKEPVGTSAHFFEWRSSQHANQAVSCDKCHGGNPNTGGYKLAHEGVLSPTFTQSTLHPKNLAQTCGTCHQEIANAFAKSRHSQVLQESGNGPSCTNCHRHMASSVINWPPDTTALCAQCHKTNGAAAQHLQVPKQAGETIAAFTRSDGVLDWAKYLLIECKRQQVFLPQASEKIRHLEFVNKQAKVQWHEFNLSASRRTADEVFLRATEIKDGIWSKLPK